VAAAIPAVLFYVALYMQVDIQAAKWGLKGLSSAQLPPFKKVFQQWGHLSLPIAVLLYMLLIEALSPIRAALWSTLTCVMVSWVKKDSRMKLPAIIKALQEGALGSLSVIVACGCAGIVVGLVSLTGVGIKLSSAIVTLSGGHLFVALILTMTITIILSMGLPTTGAYIIAAVVMGPALAKFGISNLQAHLFIFYFACMSAVTPPVALVAYPAAGIAGGDPMKVGFIAWRLCLVAFIVPFMFVYSPALIFVGSYAQIIWSTITAVLGVYLLTAGTSGWFWGQTTPFWQNAVFLAASLALIHSGIVTDLIGLAVLMIFAFLRFYEVKSGRAEGKI
jgi:TRAP transporter 4TM/12TM fusion protein